MFVCPRWLSANYGNTIALPPTGDLAVGTRASRRAARRISDSTIVRTPYSKGNESRSRFESLVDRFTDAQPGEVVANGSEVGTKRIHFSLQKFTTHNAHMYLCGSIPALGEYRPERACRMTPSCRAMEGHWRGEWGLDIEIDDDFDEIRYRYMVVYEGENRSAIITEPEYTIKLSAYTADRHTEDNVITVKNNFRTNMEGDPLSSASTYHFAPNHSNHTVNTPNGRGQLLNAQLTPSCSVPISYAVQHDVNGALEANVTDPVSSESSSSVPRVSEDCSLPNDERDGHGNMDYGDGGEATLRDMPHWTHATNDVERSDERYTRSGGRSRRRQSDELSTESTSSHMRSAEKRSSRSRENGRIQHDNSEDFSLKSEIPADENLDIITREEARELRKECEALQANQSRTTAERDALVLEVDNLRVELDSTVREYGLCRATLELRSNAEDNNQFDRDEELYSLREELTKVSSERDVAYRAANVTKTERDAALENYEVIRKEREAALVQAENVNPSNDAILIEIGNLRTQALESQEDRDAVLAERDTIAEENKKLKEQLERSREADSERNKTYSRLSETHKSMLDELEQLRAEVVCKQEDIDTQAANLNRLLAEKQAEVDAQIREAEEERVGMHERWIKEFNERRRLFNVVQELRGNIRVFCRVRPLKSHNISAAVGFPDDGVDENSRILLGNKMFEFDQVFRPASSQQEVYDETAGVVQSVVDGYNVCVFAYGQTGSGKTYTMNGSTYDRGVNYRALESLFSIAAERKKSETDVRIVVSMLEIYNENLRDLILPDHLVDSQPKLEIRKDISTNSTNAVHVPNLTEIEVGTFDETWAVMEQGSLNRSKGRTDMNEHSSRSHLIVRVTVWCEDSMNGERTRGVLHLVDLAGSERVSRSNASGDRLKEAQHINKSLSSLGDVFAALVKSNSAHVPYRNSKLTYLLQDSLGGDSKTLMFVNVSGDMSDESETLSSLQFAQRVAKVELGSARKHSERGADPKALQEKEAQNTELFSKVQSLQRELRKRDECIVDMRVRERSLEENVKELAVKEFASREDSAKEVRELKATHERDALDLKAASTRYAELERSKDEELRRVHTTLRQREKDIAGLTVAKGAEDQVRRLQTQLYARDREIAELRNNNGGVGASSKASNNASKKSTSSAIKLGTAGATPASIPGPFHDRPCSVPSAPCRSLAGRDNSGVTAQGGNGRTATAAPVRMPRTASSPPGRLRQVRFDNNDAHSNASSSADGGSSRNSLDIGPAHSVRKTVSGTTSAAASKIVPATTGSGAAGSSTAAGAKSSLKIGVLAPPRRAKAVGNAPVRTLSGTRGPGSSNSASGSASLRHSASATMSIPGGLGRKAVSSYSMRAADNRTGAAGSALPGHKPSSSSALSLPTPGAKQLPSQTRTSRLPRSQTAMLRPPQRILRPGGVAGSDVVPTGRGAAALVAPPVRNSTGGGSGPGSTGGNSSNSSSSASSDRIPSLKMPLRRAGTVAAARLAAATRKTQGGQQ